MKIFKEKFEIDLKQFRDIPIDHEIIDRIKRDLLEDLYNYFNMPIHLIYNVNNLYCSRSEIIINYIDSIHTLEDVLNMAVTSLGNSKLGNRILVWNLSCYFNCHGLKSLNCTCTKECYAGKLEFRQFKKNVRNNIFYLYCKYTNDLKLFEDGIKLATNKQLQKYNTALYELSAIRYNEVGEIKDSTDLKFIKIFRGIFERIVKTSWTYTTTPEINTHDIDGVIINKSCGFNLDLIKPNGNSYTCIISEPEDIKEIYYRFKDDFKISLCSGTCRTCRKCTRKNNIIVFVLHGNKSHEQLIKEIKQTETILKNLEAVNNE